MRSTMLLTVLTLSVNTLLLSCSKSGSGGGSFTPDCSTSKSFATDVMPVIQSTCAINSSCHASGSIEGVGALTNYNQVFTSRFSIRDAVITGRMPKTGSISNAQKNAIICWIDAGAANN